MTKINRFIRSATPSATLVAILYCVVIWGCTQTTGPPSEKKPDSMKIRIASPAPGLQKRAATAILVISHPEMDSIHQPLTITNSTLEAEISGLTEGTRRHFEVMVFDTAKTMIYYGESISDVVPSALMNVSITLGHVGTIKVEGIVKGEID